MKPGGIFDPDALKNDIDKLEKLTSEPNFWNERERAEEILSKLKKLRRKYDPWIQMREDVDEVRVLYQLAEEEQDESFEEEISMQLTVLRERYGELKLLELLGDQYDESDAFLTIHSGAGGTEACDWVSMLLRLYSRWSERRGFKTQILDILEAEGGIKSVTLQLSGTYAFGYLRGESGIHRLVRISPFDSSSRRHTSFASVYASPVIEDDIEVDIRPDEIRVDTYRAQGAGGQHVNKTDSAVRITHIETGIVVQCQNERSQHKNKATAMKVLRSRLYERFQSEREEEQQKHAIEKKDISWGNQIRSYVFHPYNMVKDHRTKFETGNVQAVMDGDIEQFIEEYLKVKWSG
ncbi:MAG: peptide chain release factor 2 [Spirochaetales bacterium]|nr:peptide chain release factor 2 [Spirochaetales bacterium]